MNAKQIYYNYDAIDRSLRKSKIFGIGLSKTGTTSLTTALNILGLNIVHFPSVTDFFEIIKTTDGATDTPAAMYYRTLYEIYPDAKFILTIREENSWVKSARAEFENRPARTEEIQLLRRTLYSSDTWDEEKYLSSYKNYNEEVLQFFADKKEKLLVLDIFFEDSWNKICEFLNLTPPGLNFPHMNITQHANSDKIATNV